MHVESLKLLHEENATDRQRLRARHIALIRDLAARGISGAQISRSLPISASQVNRIKNGENWGWM